MQEKGKEELMKKFGTLIGGEVLLKVEKDFEYEF